MYPPIFYMLKCLIFKQLLKIDNISAKIDILSYSKSLQFRKFAVPLLSETGTIPDTAKLIDNIDSENASRDGLCVLCLFAVCHYAI